MGERKDRSGPIFKDPIIESVVERIANTAFSAKFDPRVEIGVKTVRKIAKRLGFKEEDVLRKAREYLPYALTAPTLGYKIGKDVKRAFKKRRRGRRKGRRR